MQPSFADAIGQKEGLSVPSSCESLCLLTCDEREWVQGIPRAGRPVVPTPGFVFFGNRVEDN